MDSGAGFKLCQPSLAILLVAIAGVLYHLVVGAGRGTMWWLAVGAVGTVVFQALCYGGLEPIAWVLMMIPVLLVCFFLAVALFASSMRIQNVEKDCRQTDGLSARLKVPCGRCGHKRPCGCGVPSTSCNSCGPDDRHCLDGCASRKCPYCQGGGCPRCLLGRDTA